MLLQNTVTARSYIDLVEHDIPQAYPMIPYRSFTSYLPLKEASLLLRVPPRELLRRAARSRKLHVILLETNYVLVHPDFITRTLFQRYERMLANPDA